MAIRLKNGSTIGCSVEPSEVTALSAPVDRYATLDYDNERYRLAAEAISETRFNYLYSAAVGFMFGWRGLDRRQASELRSSGFRVAPTPATDLRCRSWNALGTGHTVWRILLLLTALFAIPQRLRAAERSTAEQSARSVIKQTCSECHNAEASEGGLNLLQLPWKLDDVANRQQWIRVHDKVASGEMPPNATTLGDSDRQSFLRPLAAELHSADYADVVANGRGPMRRLTREEFEQNLRDILHMPHLDIRDMLPPDRERYHCNKVAEVLDVSRVQLDACLDAAETALLHAVASGMKPRDAVRRHFFATQMFEEATTFGGREAMFYAKDSQLVPLTKLDLQRFRKDGDHDPDMELAIFRSPSWPYYGYPAGFVVSEAGEFRVRFSARVVRQRSDFTLRPARDPIPMTFRARKRSGPDVSGDVRATGGVMDIQPEVAEYKTTIRLKKNETFEYSLLGLPVPRAINPDNAPLYYDFPPMPEGGHPGIAFQWLELTGPIDSETWPPESHRVLFDDLPIRPASKGRLAVELVSEQPERDASRLLRRFIQRTGHYPLTDEEIAVYGILVIDQLNSGETLAEALLAGYSAFLCSGHFMYLHDPVAVASSHRAIQTPGTAAESLRHVSRAIAARLSHLLANTLPDSILTKHAQSGAITNRKTLSQETNRLIAATSFENFVHNFTDYWLSLKDIRRDEPDARLYPEYRFDDYLIESMEAETRAFFTAMVRGNLPISVLVDADFAFINDRLARHYDLKPVTGSRLRRVTLPVSSPYGGLLTQAAIMKVTANGSTTSPVVRGAWIMERIMGEPPPAPPTTIPAIEPDIRGATTIREQLAKHTEDESCAACHAKFDPLGFALENFDIMGAWRERYRSLGGSEKVTGIDRAGHDFVYYVASSIDPSGALNDGREFSGIAELKQLLAANPRQLARNLLHQLTVYSTGTPVRFSDLRVIEIILNQCESSGYLTRDLIHGLIQSTIFLGPDSRNDHSR